MIVRRFSPAYAAFRLRPIEFERKTPRKIIRKVGRATFATCDKCQILAENRTTRARAASESQRESDISMSYFDVQSFVHHDQANTKKGAEAPFSARKQLSSYGLRTRSNVWTVRVLRHGGSDRFCLVGAGGGRWRGLSFALGQPRAGRSSVSMFSHKERTPLPDPDGW